MNNFIYEIDIKVGCQYTKVNCNDLQWHLAHARFIHSINQIICLSKMTKMPTSALILIGIQTSGSWYLKKIEGAKLKESVSPSQGTQTLWWPWGSRQCYSDSSIQILLGTFIVALRLTEVQVWHKSQSIQKFHIK